ncbi:MAG: L-iditol 2-dehydrogenase [Pseudonocardiales bacterium]|nr:L-iditol 2-dehydrogenase [Pseudonocardiales bacterium]
MRCAALHAPGDVRVEQRPDPVAGPGESLVRITSVGLCGSDLHWFAEGAIGDAALADPLVLGHEMAGVVVSGPLAGRTVGLDPAVPCGTCRECVAGLEHLCTRMRFAGHGATDGGLRELMAWPDRHLHELPDGCDPACGALLEPLGVAVHSADLAHLRHGGTVAVVGCGPIGLMLVQLAVMVGCEVLAVEPLAHRREAALRAGAARAVAPEAVTRSAADEGTCDVAFEVSGADDGVDRAAVLVRPGARIVLVGIPGDDTTTFAASTMRRKGLTLACVRRMTENAYARAIALAVRGAVDLSWLTTRRFPLSDATEAFATAARREGLKVVVDVTPG